jgi:predicted transcriptional regulator
LLEIGFLKDLPPMTPLQKAERKIIKLESKQFHLERENAEKIARIKEKTKRDVTNLTKKHAREIAKLTKENAQIILELNKLKSEAEKHDIEAIMTKGWLKLFGEMKRDQILLTASSSTTCAPGARSG